ncbi:hypothetical protein C8239_09040 [Paracidovorax avenae]|nr:hypothetical protein C8239_09040 [Paracidovorax avenae]AVT04378.1 hypothetical protein C8243_08800 [Paracidovorax avenae]
MADYNEGTVLVEEGITRMQGQADITFTRTTTTGARQDFAGARPVMFIPRSNAAMGDNREFRDLVNGNELSYGVVSDTSTQVLTQVYDPPVSTPLDMQPGQTVERNYTIQTTVVAKADNGTVTTKDTVQERFTYTGMQTVQTAMGTFNVCKFNTDQVIVSPNAGTVQANFQLWTVSDGPYRGRTIKIASSSSNGLPSTTEMTKITYTSK